MCLLVREWTRNLLVFIQPLKVINTKPHVVLYIYNSNTEEAEVEGQLQVQSYCAFPNKFQAILR